MKRARRMRQGAATQIVPVNEAAAWRDCGLSRSAWFSRTPVADGQVLALEAFVRRGDRPALERIAAHIAEAKRVQQTAGTSKKLKVDDLLARLDAVLSRTRLATPAQRRDLGALLSSVVTLDYSFRKVASNVTIERMAPAWVWM